MQAILLILVTFDFNSIFILPRKTFSGSTSWDCKSISGWQNLEVSNFSGCDISGTIYIYSSWTPQFSTTFSYNKSTGILSVNVNVANKGEGVVSFYPQPTISIQPIVIKS